MKKLSKTEAEKKIKKFFSEIKDKSPVEVKKIKKFAMRHSIKLKERRKKFCKKCYSPYINPRVRIKNKIKSVECANCGFVSKWRIKE